MKRVFVLLVLLILLAYFISLSILVFTENCPEVTSVKLRPIDIKLADKRFCVGVLVVKIHANVPDSILARDHSCLLYSSVSRVSCLYL